MPKSSKPSSRRFPAGRFQAPESRAYDTLGSALGDRRDGRVYVYDDRVRHAIDVAIATRRPLLLRGPAGSGKSSLAPFVARTLRHAFYYFTVTARTESRDLMYGFDALDRLNDAQLRTKVSDRKIQQLESYIEPRALWWAFDPVSARRRGLVKGSLIAEPAEDPGKGSSDAGVVVLIDEIDKADPDVPNSLLEALGSWQFTVQETGRVVTATRRPLVMITTNDERELPNAFLRRCAVLHLPPHTPTTLETIASAHFGDTASAHFPSAEARTALFARVAEKLVEFQGAAEREERRPPSTAEYLDALRACLELGADPAQPAALWAHVEALTLLKQKPQDAGASSPIVQ